MSVWGGLLLAAGLGVLVIAFGDLIPQFSSRRVVVGLLGICGLLSGGLLLFSRRYVWRTRFYLFFAGIGLIVLVGRLGDTGGAAGEQGAGVGAPLVSEKLGFDPATAVFITHPSMIHAVAWVYHRPDAGCMSRKENSHTESPGPNRRARFRSA